MKEVKYGVYLADLPIEKDTCLTQYPNDLIQTSNFCCKYKEVFADILIR